MRIMLGRPYANLLIKLDRARMIRHGEVSQRLVFFRPFFEQRMESLKFREIFPPCLHHRIDGLFTDFGGAHEMERITNHMGLAFHSSGWVWLYDSSAVAGQRFVCCFGIWQINE